jgi:hypothetical protein
LCLQTDDNNNKPNHNTTTYCDWVYCWSVKAICGRIMIGFSLLSSVNTICGHIMIGLSLLSVSKHNMWSYYDWVYYDHILCLLTDENNNKPSDNMTIYCVYWRTTTTINPIIIRPHCMFTDRRQQRQPNHNTTKYCAYWRKTTTTQS